MGIVKKKKIYGVSSLARNLGVHRQTVNYWIKKGWVTPKRDYRDYPVFTEDQIVKIIDWMKAIK